MMLDQWISGCKVHAEPWIDGKRIYFNIEYYRPGQSTQRPPAWEKTVYVLDNDAGRRLVYELTHTLVAHVREMSIPDNVEVTLGDDEDALRKFAETAIAKRKLAKEYEKRVKELDADA